MKQSAFLWVPGFLALVGLIGSTGAARADLLVNGDFEMHSTLPTDATAAGGSSLTGVQSQAHNQFFTVYGDANGPYAAGSQRSTAITGWTVTGVSVDYKSSSYWTPSHGQWSIDLDGTSRVGDNGNAAGGIQQTISTIAGHSYTVTFDMSGNPEGGLGTKALQVSAAGQSSDFSFDVFAGQQRSGNMGWQTHTWSFVADSGSTTLSFASLVAGDFGAALDYVNVVDSGATTGPIVQSAPEPTSLTLILLGSLGVARLSRRRRA
jgi:choice-of-anchor C domain-containing protein